MTSESSSSDTKPEPKDSKKAAAILVDEVYSRVNACFYAIRRNGEVVAEPLIPARVKELLPSLGDYVVGYNQVTDTATLLHSDAASSFLMRVTPQVSELRKALGRIEAERVHVEELEERTLRAESVSRRAEEERTLRAESVSRRAEEERRAPRKQNNDDFEMGFAVGAAVSAAVIVIFSLIGAALGSINYEDEETEGEKKLVFVILDGVRASAT
jgi:hypothetical protein